MARKLDTLLNLREFEERAGAKLPRAAFAYFAGGACDECTLRDNLEAFQRLRLKPKVLVDVSHRDLATSVLGQKVAMPILIAPTALHRLAHPEGELATARAAGAAGTVMVLSTLATCSLEEAAKAAAGPLWFQLYVYKDRGLTKELVQRAEAAGYQALVLTVDAPLLGRREADLRRQFRLPAGTELANLRQAGLKRLPAAKGESKLAAYFASLLDPSLTWRDVEWLRSLTRLPVLVKGVLRADDAVRSVEAGAAGVIVSNHGGRQLDTVPATITVLPEIAAAVAGRAEVLLDGGIRRGTDVLKALALGAKAVLVGRPVLWGLAVGGQAGVSRVLGLLRGELDLAMALCGCPSVQAITADLIA
ncbi:MAG: alpha-hydroxy acid oxidase [Nitrospirota bacterium]